MITTPGKWGIDSVLAVVVRHTVVMVVPILLMFPLLAAMVRLWSYLEAIATINPSVIGELLEEVEEAAHFQEEVARKLRNRMQDIGAGEEAVSRMFEEIDKFCRG